MTHYFYTNLVECETYEDFRNTISTGDCRFLSRDPRDDYYSTDNYLNAFKGFSLEEFYYPNDFDYAHFLYEIVPRNFKNFLSPEFDVKTKTVTFFENLDKRNKGIRSNPTKIGKFFRKIAPYFNDKQIEFLVNYTVDYFTDSIYTHHIAKGKDISNIYLSKTESGRNVGKYSCINASCMRHNDWEIHPTEVYGTDSWELHYLTNEDGDIGARALICRDDNAYNYIYASCEHAGETLEHELKDLGFVDCEEVRYAFKGAKLLKIEGNGGLVAPYIDYHYHVKDCGDYLEITYGYSDYSFNGTCGYVECETTYECSCCYKEISEDDVISVGGELYCSDCTFFCEHFNEYAVGEPVSVYYSTDSHYNVCEYALSDMGAVYNEEENEWQTAEWYEECTKEEEEDIECEKDTKIEIQPKKEIKVGDKCVVIAGYQVYHYFPIGSVVNVTEKVREGAFDCVCEDLTQIVKESDLVVVE